MEITISLVVLTAGVVGILVLFPVAFDASKRSSDITEAGFYLQSKMEDVRRDGYSSLPVSGSSDSGTFSGTDYSWTLESDDVISGELAEVTLTVSWQRSARAHTEKLITYVYNE